MKKVLSLVIAICLILGAIPCMADGISLSDITESSKYIDKYDDCTVAIYDNAVYIWGGDYGEIPVKILDKIKELKAVGRAYNSYSYYAICEDNSLYVWGAHGSYANMMPGLKPSKYTYVGGMLGLPCNTNVKPQYDGPSNNIDWSKYNDPSPHQKTPVKLLDNVKKVITGSGKVVALGVNGEVYIWGQYSGANKNGDYSPKLINSNAEEVYVTGTSPALDNGKIGVLEKDGSFAVYSGSHVQVRVDNVVKVFGTMYIASYTPAFLVLTKEGKVWELQWDKKLVMENVTGFESIKGTIYIKTADGTVYEKVSDGAGFKIQPTDKEIEFEDLRADKLTYENFIYEITDEKSVTITGLVDKNVKEVIIPQYINSSVVYVAPFAFRDCTNIEYADVTKLYSVPMGLFQNCTNLKQVRLSEQNKEIGASAFENCTSLEYINLEETLTIRHHAFSGCTKLEEVYFEYSHYQGISIEKNAFENCTSLKYIDLSDAGYLGTNAFYNCPNLEFVYLESLNDFETFPFGKCEKLEYVYITKEYTDVQNFFRGTSSNLKVLWGRERYKNQKNNAYTITEKNGIKTMTVTGYIEGLDNEDYNAFFNERNIYKDVDVIVIEKEVQRIGYGAFRDMENLKEVVIKSPVVTIRSDAFSNCKNLEKIEFPEYGRINVWDNAFSDCDKLKEVEIKASVQSLESNAFTACDGLEKVIFPERGETDIHREAFSLCNKLTEIRLTEGIQSIDGTAFNTCDNLTKIIIGKNVNDSLFAPLSYYKMDCQLNVFNANSALETIEVEEGNRFYKVEDNVLYNSEKTVLYRYLPTKIEKEFAIPEGVKAIRNGAFMNEQNLEVITVPGTVSEIDVFELGGVSLKKLNLCEGVKKVYGYAFLRSEIENLIIPESMEQFVSVYYRPTPKTSATTYVLHAGIKNLHYRGSEARLDLWDITEYVDNVNVFYDYTENDTDGEYDSENVYEYKDYKYYLLSPKNTKAEMVKVPAFIKGCEVVITPYAFSNMPNLREVLLAGGVKVIPEGAFKNSKELTKINLENVEHIGKDAFSGTSIDNIKLLNIKAWDAPIENIDSLKNVCVKFPYNENETPLFKSCANLEKAYVINANDFIHKDEFALCEKVCVYSGIEKVRGYFNLKGIKTQKGQIECQYSLEKIESGEKIKFLGGVYQYKNDTLYYLYPERVDAEIYIAANINGVKVKLKDNVLSGNNYVKRVHLDEDIKEIPNNAFSNCASLEYINLENIETIGETAFKNCASLEEITLLNIKYWHGARYMDANLKTMKAPYLPYFSDRAPFIQCDNLTKMTVKWPDKYLGNDTKAERDSSKRYMQELIPASVKEVHMLNAPKNIYPYEFKSFTVKYGGDIKKIVDLDVTIYGNSKAVENYAKSIGLKFEYIK